MADLKITITRNDGSVEEKVVKNSYIPEFIGVLIDIIRTSFEKVIVTKQ
jgi:hypothetical protein